MRAPMKAARKAALLIALLAASGPLSASSLPEPVRKALSAAAIPAERTAVWVQPIGGAQPTVDHNATASLNPASVIKLVTTMRRSSCSVRRTLEHRSMDRRAAGGDVLNGDLYLRGGGDPKLPWKASGWCCARSAAGASATSAGSGARPELDRCGRLQSREFDAQPLQPSTRAPCAAVNFKAFRFWFAGYRAWHSEVLSEPPSSSLDLKPT